MPVGDDLDYGNWYGKMHLNCGQDHCLNREGVQGCIQWRKWAEQWFAFILTWLWLSQALEVLTSSSWKTCLELWAKYNHFHLSCFRQRILPSRHQEKNIRSQQATQDIPLKNLVGFVGGFKISWKGMSVHTPPSAAEVSILWISCLAESCWFVKA